MTASWDVGPRFLSKTLRILNYFALNGPSNKTEIERHIDPKIDKPTIYKGVSLLERNQCIEQFRKKPTGTRNLGGPPKYYRITYPGFEELLKRCYTIRNRVSDRTILSMIEKNPHLGYDEEWINVYQALRPVLVEANKSGKLQQQLGGIVPLVLAENPRLVLSAVIWLQISQAKDGNQASPRIRRILKILAPYPAYFYQAEEILTHCETLANNELENAKAQLAKIQRVTSDLPKLKKQFTPRRASYD